MKCFALFAILVFPLSAPADDTAKAKASALLKLNALHRGPVAASPLCECEECDCLPCTCLKCGYCSGEECCPMIKGKAFALLEKKVLFVWVGMDPDPKTVKAFPDVVHVKVVRHGKCGDKGLVVPGKASEFWFAPSALNAVQIRQVMQTGRLPAVPVQRPVSFIAAQRPGGSC
jgi:hypothetical protein